MNDALSAKIEEWSKPPFDEETRAQLNLLKQNPEQLDDAFYKDLEFGTGGMRGIMGIGTNRINAYTLGKKAPKVFVITLKVLSQKYPSK